MQSQYLIHSRSKDFVRHKNTLTICKYIINCQNKQLNNLQINVEKASSPRVAMNKTHQVLRVDSRSGETQKAKTKEKKKKWIFGEAKMQIKSLSTKSSKQHKLETRNHDSVLMNWL